jgi:hypothetical protein
LSFEVNEGMKIRLFFLVISFSKVPNEARPKVERSLGNCVEKEENG